MTTPTRILGLLLLSGLACSGRGGPAPGLYTRTSLGIVSNGSETPFDDSDTLATIFMSRITIVGPNSATLANGESEFPSYYRVSADSIFFSEKAGGMIALAGRFRGDTLDLNLRGSPVAQEDTIVKDGVLHLRFTRSH